ncbi:unnamed protein product [Spodoptera littoralis]|uniref:Peptidase S1 domain-containing protein n=1 Tax=Spodoptera littoralis TaxID=7109 RepID=A0A9P0IC24_SPOLI|nr:unnamed protein product [Spodoptera littoralis]CAH1642509.1 unnamed protein product [Spodoptera littoralis]
MLTVRRPALTVAGDRPAINKSRLIRGRCYQKGVRQGDVISPKLFTNALEDVFKRLNWSGLGININGEYITHLRFADDVVIMAESLEDLNTMLSDLDWSSVSDIDSVHAPYVFNNKTLNLPVCMVGLNVLESTNENPSKSPHSCKSNSSATDSRRDLIPYRGGRGRKSRRKSLGNREYSFLRSEKEDPPTRRGERCETEQGVGKCVHVFKCLSSIVDLKAKSQPKGEVTVPSSPACLYWLAGVKDDKEQVSRLWLAFIGRPEWSRESSNPARRVRNYSNAIVDTGGGVYFKSGRKAIDKCLEHLSYLPYPCQTRGLEKIWDNKKQCNYYEVKFYAVVHGGENAERSRYPHMALLGYGQEVDSAQWLCGGSLISDRFILTAAHCIIETAIGPVTFVAMGILKRSDPMKLWQIYKVKRIMQHPEYAPPSKYNDIALIEIDRPVKYSKDVFPACLDYEGQDQFNAQATGWGKLGKHQPLADNLQTVTLQKFSSEQCLKNYPPHRLLKQGYNSETQLCYGDLKEPKDTCEHHRCDVIRASVWVCRRRRDVHKGVSLRAVDRERRVA